MGLEAVLIGVFFLVRKIQGSGVSKGVGEGCKGQTGGEATVFFPV